MKSWIRHLPNGITLAAVAALALHGPVEQLPDYHRFADDTALLGLPHAADVLSNLGFALVAIWGALRLAPSRGHASLRRAWPGYALFLAALFLTALGSAYYHLAPDNPRLVWDRIPIALACAGLLAAVRAETHAGAHPLREVAALGLLAVGSVAWWTFTDQHGRGDLRPYLLLQGLPLVLIPLWQAIHGSSGRDRAAFGLALLLYLLAKAAELHDHELLAALGGLSGHTLKHLLATAAAALIVARLIRRLAEPAGADVAPASLAVAGRR